MCIDKITKSKRYTSCVLSSEFSLPRSFVYACVTLLLRQLPFYNSVNIAISGHKVL